MTNDWSSAFATDLTEYLSQGSDLPAAPGTVYVALFDSTGTEVTGDFANGRVGLTTPGDWNQSGSAFDNAADIEFGEATADVSDIEFVGLWDSATGGLEFVRGDFLDSDTPFDVSSGSTLTINSGTLNVDILD
jgi:hypothetical protein